MANLAEPLRLRIVAPAGRNPGDLRMLTYVPPGLPEGAPLVVVLHGCTQNAAAYDHGAGWSTLAERHGFALLFPEQQRSNNPQLCFNWFHPEDVTRGQGEAESIRAMVEQMLRTHPIDPRRVFITGLSAGGAMTAAMLATAPELFAAGAIIAGLPFGSATSVSEAFTAMGTGRRWSSDHWGELVRAASPHRGPRPLVQVWHGDADQTVSAENGRELTRQWANAMGLPEHPTTADQVDGARHETWLDAAGQPRLERWAVPGLGHGTPIMPDGADLDHSVGAAGPHMLASSVSSTWHLARSWGLLTQPSLPRAGLADTAAGSQQNARQPGPQQPQAGWGRVAGASFLSGASGPTAIIGRALRTAGLVR